MAPRFFHCWRKKTGRCLPYYEEHSLSAASLLVFCFCSTLADVPLDLLCPFQRLLGQPFDLLLGLRVVCACPDLVVPNLLEGAIKIRSGAVDVAGHVFAIS